LGVTMYYYHNTTNNPKDLAKFDKVV
jgi:hypothetical protein